MILSNRINAIKPSPTMAITAKAIELKQQGKNVISLSAGEPDFNTPDNVKQAGIDAINNNITRYTPVSGTLELKNAIKAKFKRENGLDYENNQIIAGVGGKQVLFNAILATINDGDEVIIPAPYWVSYPDMVLLAGGKPIFANCFKNDGFKLTPENLEKSITDKTKWLILNSPSNPTGATYTKDELIVLAEVLKKYPHVWIMSDDIYEHLVYDDTVFYNIAQVAPELYDRTLVINGVSKAYSMTGWRIGYAGGDEELIKAMGKIQSQSTSNPCSISQVAATEALNGSQEFLNKWRDSFKKRRDFVVGELNSIEGINCLTPQGAFYVYPSIGGIVAKGKITNCLEFSKYLLEEYLVAVVPGSAFGMGGHFRISYATSYDLLEEGLERIKDACEGI